MAATAHPFDVTGYRPELEDNAALVRTQAMFSPSLADAAEAPEEIDHRGWLEVEWQDMMGSCCGHAFSTCLEVCNFYDTGGDKLQFSRMYAYLTAQKYGPGGLLGSDRGATIYGAARAGSIAGICLEQTFPYPNPVRYSSKIPQSATDEGIQHLLLRHTLMGSYEDGITWLRTGQGAIIIGVRWVASMRNTKGVVESISGGGGGFHAMAIVGYSKRKDKRGRNYLWLVNSHGKQWGNQGWAEIAPAVFDQWCKRKDGEELIGVSDIEEYNPREVTLFGPMI